MPHPVDMATKHEVADTLQKTCEGVQVPPGLPPVQEEEDVGVASATGDAAGATDPDGQVEAAAGAPAPQEVRAYPPQEEQARIQLDLTRP